ncbi:MAG: hypothetical protein QW589_05065 [Candidatus Bathyarchaeia archaeon]
MAVRLKLRIRIVDNKFIDTVALLNSGYEAPTPQLLVPINIARSLGLWPPEEASEITLESAGGPLRVWYYPRKAYTKIITEDLESKEVLVDIVVSPLADEALINDMLAEELEIAVESFGKGLWRFRWEPKEKTRASEKRA